MKAYISWLTEARLESSEPAFSPLLPPTVATRLPFQLFLSETLDFLAGHRADVLNQEQQVSSCSKPSYHSISETLKRKAITKSAPNHTKRFM